MNILILIGGIILAAIGTYIFVDVMKRPVKRVDLLRPRDSRGTTLKVVEETDLGLICKKSKGVTHRFIKIGRGWTFSTAGRMVTRFLGLEGTAYTALIEGPVLNEMPLSQYLRQIVWDEEFYNEIPDEQKRAVEEDLIGVTVEVRKIDETTRDLPLLSGDNIHDEGDNTVLRILAKRGAEGGAGKSLLNQALGVLVGALLMYMCLKQGWF